MQNLCFVEILKISLFFSVNCKAVTIGLAAIGLGVVAVRSLKALHSFYRYAIRPSKNLIKWYGDNWAVVTGASDGIGKVWFA